MPGASRRTRVRLGAPAKIPNKSNVSTIESSFQKDLDFEYHYQLDDSGDQEFKPISEKTSEKQDYESAHPDSDHWTHYECMFGK